MKKYYNRIMMLVLLITTSLLFTSCNNQDKQTYSNYVYEVFHDGLVVVKKDNRFGYLNNKGETIIDFIYDYAANFINGKAIVKIDDEYTLIDVNGNTVLEETYQYLKYANNGLYWYRTNDNNGLLKSDGTIITRKNYTKTGSFHEGLAKVLTETESGFINNNGELIINVEYFKADDFFQDGMLIVGNLISACSYINSNGESIGDEVYRSCDRFKDGQAIVSYPIQSGILYKVIDKSGKDVFLGYDKIVESKTRYIAKKGDEYYLLDRKGKKVIDKPINYHYTDFALNYILCLKDNVYEVINENGNVIYKYNSNDKRIIDRSNYSNVLIYNEDGIYEVNSRKKINIDTYDEIEDYINGRFVVLKDSKYAVYDIDGKQLLDFEYDRIYLPDQEYAILKKDNKYCLYHFASKTTIINNVDGIVNNLVPYIFS